MYDIFIMFMLFHVESSMRVQKCWKKKCYYYLDYFALKIKIYELNSVEIVTCFVSTERERERDDLLDRERLEKRYNFIRKDILTINGLILGLAGKIKIAVASVAPSTPPLSSNFLFLRCRDRVEDRRVTGSGGQIKIHVPLASTVLINSEDRRDRPC